uniref:Uncharacterized protein n=1 Tax=Arundo donax TaxID=35708 RepID=A0A0A8YIP5_ARUDO
MRSVFHLYERPFVEFFHTRTCTNLETNTQCW